MGHWLLCQLDSVQHQSECLHFALPTARRPRWPPTTTIAIILGAWGRPLRPGRPAPREFSPTSPPIRSRTSPTALPTPLGSQKHWSVTIPTGRSGVMVWPLGPRGAALTYLEGLPNPGSYDANAAAALVMQDLQTCTQWFNTKQNPAWQNKGGAWANGSPGLTICNTIVTPNSQLYPWSACRFGCRWVRQRLRRLRHLLQQPPRRLQRGNVRRQREVHQELRRDAHVVGRWEPRTPAKSSAPIVIDRRTTSVLIRPGRP